MRAVFYFPAVAVLTSYARDKPWPGPDRACVDNAISEESDSPVGDDTENENRGWLWKNQGNGRSEVEVTLVSRTRRGV
jgi:hypothetical protein